MNRNTRLIIQLVFLLLSLILISFLIFGVLGIAHKYCPYAGVCFGIFSLNPQITIWLFKTAAILGLLIAFSSIFWGRKFCGYICVLGTIQELIFKLKKRKSRFKQHIPVKLHRWLRILKYLLFAFTVVTSYFALQYLYMKFCPVLALAHPQNITFAAGISLAFIFLAGWFVERFWCRYLCPYAALMNIFQFLGTLLGIRRKMIHRNIDKSMNCNNCKNYCPMNIHIDCLETIKNMNCIHCGRCIRYCSLQDSSKENCLYC